MWEFESLLSLFVVSSLLSPGAKCVFREKGAMGSASYSVPVHWNLNRSRDLLEGGTGYSYFQALGSGNELWKDLQGDQRIWL